MRFYEGYRLYAFHFRPVYTSGNELSVCQKKQHPQNELYTPENAPSDLRAPTTPSLFFGMNNSAPGSHALMMHTAVTMFLLLLCSSYVPIPSELRYAHTGTNFRR